MIQDRLSQAITPANVWREHEVSSVKTGLSFSGRKCSFHVKHNRLVLRSIEWIFRSFIYSNTFAYQRQPRLDITRIPKEKNQSVIITEFFGLKTRRRRRLEYWYLFFLPLQEDTINRGLIQKEAILKMVVNEVYIDGVTAELVLCLALMSRRRRSICCWRTTLDGFWQRLVRFLRPCPFSWPASIRFYTVAARAFEEGEYVLETAADARRAPTH